MAGAAGFDGTQVLYAGGTRRDGTAANEIWAYRNNTWTKLATMSRGRQALSAVSDDTGQVLFLAGRDAGRDERTGVRYGDIDRVARGMLAAPQPGASAMVDPPVDAAGGVRLDGIGVCLVGGQTGPDRYNDWWCEQPRAAASLPRLDPARAGLGVARIGKTVYTVGGRGNGFRGTNRVETYTPPD
jgi:hypothetical protein